MFGIFSRRGLRPGPAWQQAGFAQRRHYDAIWAILPIALAVIGAIGAFAVVQANGGRVGFAASGDRGQPTLSIEHGWARATSAATDVGVAYLVIRNDGDGDDRLIRAEAEGASSVELHVTRTENGITHMEPAGPQAIPAHGRLAFAPGGLHFMLMGLQKPLVAGGRLVLRLDFERSGTIAVTLPVETAGAAGPPPGHGADPMHHEGVVP